MRRYLPALAFIAACTTEVTDTGQLVGFEDRMFAECEDAGSFTCGVRVSVTDGQVVAVGMTNQGATQSTSTTGTLNEAALVQLDDMIARIPMSTPDTIQESGCGLAPVRSTTLDVSFDVHGLRHFDVVYAENGAMAELNRFVLDLTSEIRLCNSTHMTFDACQPNSR